MRGNANYRRRFVSWDTRLSLRNEPRASATTGGGTAGIALVYVRGLHRFRGIVPLLIEKDLDVKRAADSQRSEY